MIIRFFAIFSLTFISTFSFAEEKKDAKAAPTDGKSLYTAKQCHTCHGAEGAKTTAPNYPKLCNQNAVYLEQQIKDIKDGKRTGGMTTLMKPFVASITDDEIKAISKFLESSSCK